MKKKVFFLLFSLLIVISLVMVGCSSSPSSTPAQTTSAPPASTSSAAPPPASTSAPATSSAAPTSSSPAFQITLKYADQNPEQGWEGQHAGTPWLKDITQATNGQVQIQPYYNQSLCKGADTWNAVANGVADIGWMVMGYWQGIAPLSTVMTLPFLPFKSATQSSGIYYQLLQKYPQMMDEYSPNVVLASFTTSPYYLITTKKQVKTMADWKGLKIRVLAGGPLDQAKAMGAVPLDIPMPDTYLDLQKGVLDGMTDCWEANLAFKHYEVVKYYTYWTGGTVNNLTVCMNKQKWDSIPPDVQKEMEKVVGMQGSLYWGYNQFDTSAAAGPGIVKASGNTMINYTVPPDELAKWEAVSGKPLWDAWVKKMEAAGHPQAQEILNTLLDLIKTYNPPTTGLSSNTY